MAWCSNINKTNFTLLLQYIEQVLKNCSHLLVCVLTVSNRNTRRHWVT